MSIWPRFTSLSLQVLILVVRPSCSKSWAWQVMAQSGLLDFGRWGKPWVFLNFCRLRWVNLLSRACLPSSHMTNIVDILARSINICSALMSWGWQEIPQELASPWLSGGPSALRRQDWLQSSLSRTQGLRYRDSLCSVRQHGRVWYWVTFARLIALCSGSSQQRMLEIINV